MTNKNKVTFNYNRDKKKKKQIILNPSEKILEFEGRKFKVKGTKYKKVDGMEHEDKVIFEEVDMTKEKKKIDFIKTKLKKKIPTDRIVEEVLKGASTKVINKLHKLLKSKKTKIKRHNGCLGLKIDGGPRNSVYIELFD